MEEGGIAASVAAAVSGSLYPKRLPEPSSDPLPLVPGNHALVGSQILSVHGLENANLHTQATQERLEVLCQAKPSSEAFPVTQPELVANLYIGGIGGSRLCWHQGVATLVAVDPPQRV